MFFKPNVHKLREKQDVNGLLKALSYKFDKDPSDVSGIRGEAAFAISYLDEKSPEIKEALLFSLENDCDRVSQNAVYGLEHYKNDDAVTDALISSMKQGNHCAASVLGEMGNIRATKPLLHVLNTGDSTVRHNAASALGQLKDENALIPLAETLISFAEKAIERETNHQGASYSWDSLDDPESIKSWISSIVCTLFQFGDEGSHILKEKIQENKSDALINLLQDLKEVPGKWNYFINNNWKTTSAEKVEDDVSGVCDICHAALISGKVYKYSADRFSSIVKNGFNPFTCGIQTPTGLPLSSLGDALGMSPNEQYDDWREKAFEASSDWFICDLCASKI